MAQCKAELRSASGQVTFYCVLPKGHGGEHFNEGPLTWDADDRLLEQPQSTKRKREPKNG